MQFGDQYLEIPDFFDPLWPASVRVVLLIPANCDSSEREVLINIVKACGLDMEVDCICVEVDHALALGSAALPTQVEYLISFGIQPQRLGLQWQAPLYSWIMDHGRNWCFADKLNVISEDMERKKRLWSQLKVIKA